MPQLFIKQCYIAESSNCSTKPLSKLFTSILSTIKTCFQYYFDTNTSCYKGVLNQMSILPNSRDAVQFINQVCGMNRPKIMNRIAKISYGHICMREENLSFDNNYITVFRNCKLQ